MHEHVKARGVDKVHFDAIPLGEGDGVGHGGAARDLFLVVGSDCRAVLDAAWFGNHLCGMQQSGNQRGFSAVRMPYYSYVTDLTSLVGFHLFLPL